MDSNFVKRPENVFGKNLLEIMKEKRRKENEPTDLKGMMLKCIIEKHGLLFRRDQLPEVMGYLNNPKSRSSIHRMIDDGILRGFYISDSLFILARSLDLKNRGRENEEIDDLYEEWIDEVVKRIQLTIKSQCKEKGGCRNLNTDYASIACISKSLNLHVSVIKNALDNLSIKKLPPDFIKKQPHKKGTVTDFLNLEHLKIIMVDIHHIDRRKKL